MNSRIGVPKCVGLSWRAIFVRPYSDFGSGLTKHLDLEAALRGIRRVGGATPNDHSHASHRCLVNPEVKAWLMLFAASSIAL